MEEMSIPFGHVLLSPRQLFYQSAHTIGVVNYKPVVAGHVMAVARRRVAVSTFSPALLCSSSLS